MGGGGGGKSAGKVPRYKDKAVEHVHLGPGQLFSILGGHNAISQFSSQSRLICQTSYSAHQ